MKINKNLYVIVNHRKLKGLTLIDNFIALAHFLSRKNILLKKYYFFLIET